MPWPDPASRSMARCFSRSRQQCHPSRRAPPNCFDRCGTAIATDALPRYVSDRGSTRPRSHDTVHSGLAVGARSGTAPDQRRDHHRDVLCRGDQAADRTDRSRSACRNPLALFNKLIAESLMVVGVTGGQFRAAARFTDQHALGLRAGDALQLAIASEQGATLVTLDRRLAEAGPMLGVPAQLPT